MSPAGGRLLITKQAGSNPTPRCSAVLKLLRSFFRCLKTGENNCIRDQKEMSFAISAQEGDLWSIAYRFLAEL